MNKALFHIHILERKFLLRFVDALLICFSVWCFNRFLGFKYIDFTNSLIYLWLFTLLLYFNLLGQVFEMYNIQVSNSRFKITKSIFITTFVTTLLYVFTPYYSPELPSNRLQIVYLFIILTLPIILWRLFYIQLFFSTKYLKSIVIIGDKSKVKTLLYNVSRFQLHNVVGYISDAEINDYKGFLDIKATNIYKAVKENSVTEVIISKSGLDKDLQEKLNKDLALLFEEGIKIKSYESFYEEITDRIPKEDFDTQFYKALDSDERLSNNLYLFFSRVIDVVTSVLGLALLIALLPIIFILNILANRGPLLYTQSRVGHRGKIFTIYKLRSMIPNAESNGAVYAERKDRRITFFGRFLRRTRLDEAPQFFNILKGEMSLIGPRPERPEFVRELEKEMPFYATRHVIKPGLTGWAQVRFPYAGTTEDQIIKLQYDLFYIKQRSLYLDFKILVKTITTVLFFKGQ